MKEQYSSFIEFKKDVFPNLYKKEQEAKKSIFDKLWEIFINGFKNNIKIEV